MSARRPAERTLEQEVTCRLDAPARTVFDLVTRTDRLPEWNDHIGRVVSGPAAPDLGDEWVVQMRLAGARWHSRSRVDDIDRDRMRFTYVTRTEDGNPSRAVWDWTVEPDGDGCRVTVRWTLRPRTFWRRALLARLRHRQLRDEVATSLHRIERLAARDSSGHVREEEEESFA